MKTMVCFRTLQGVFALPVESTLAIIEIDGLVPLPAPLADVVGVLPGEPPISVLATFGADGGHVVIVVSDGLKFGLQVLEVVGVQHFGDDQIGPPPAGQDGGLVSGVISGPGQLMLVVDAKALAARL